MRERLDGLWKKFIKREPLKSRSIVLEWAAFELIEGG